jgi:hypothetical protein
MSEKSNVLSKPGNFFKSIGPSILFVALSLNGGEMLLWPNLVSNYSLSLLWFVPLILTLQWATNVEISRLTAFNGKFVLRELASNWILKLFLLALLIVTLAWPAWMSVASGTLSYLVGIPQYWTPIVAIIGMIALLPAWNNKEYYKTLETAARYGLLVVLISVVSVVGYFVIKGGFILRFGTDLIVRSKDWPLLYAAVAYGGIAGILNFTQADWIKSKGYGASKKTADFKNKENQTSFKSWMRFIATENGVLFGIGNLIGIFLIAVVAVNVLPQTSVTGFSLILEQLKALATITPVLSWMWGVGIICLFVMAQLTIMDAAGRLYVDITHSNESLKPRVSQGFVVLGILIFGLSFVIPSFKQPGFLLQLSAGMASFSFSFLPLIVLRYNHTHLPEFAKAAKWQVGLTVACSVFYAVMTVLFLITQLS